MDNLPEWLVDVANNSATTITNNKGPKRDFKGIGLLEFTKTTYPQYIAEPVHSLIASYLDKVVDGKTRKLMIFAPPQSGKLIANSIPILTSEGWKTHGELKKNDFVFGRNGEKVKVLATSEYDVANMEIEFTDGTKIKCHENHEWMVYDKFLFNPKFKILSTKKMMIEGLYFRETKNNFNKIRFLVDSKLEKKDKRGIRSISFCKPELGKCIQVEGGIYLIGENLIPTHNSELTSVRLPSYWLANRPNDPILLASYGASLAESKSRQVRSIIDSSEFKDLYPWISVDPNSRAVAHWYLKPPYRGYMKVAGSGGSITGHGAYLGIIDDPFASWKEANSPVERESVWEWYRGTFRTRIWEGGSIVLICTRWHEDDLAGRLLRLQPEEWEVLRLPALAETQDVRDLNNEFMGLGKGLPDPIGRKPNEPLSPKRYSKEELLSIQADVGSMVFAAEYQQVPRPQEGSLCKREWLSNFVYEVPLNCKRIRYWDKAGTNGGNGAATAGILLAKGDNGIWYIEDSIQGWWSAHEREEQIKKIAEKDYVKYNNKVQIFTEQEPGSGGKESAELTIQMLSGYPVYADLARGDKDSRLMPFLAQAEAGKVRLLAGAWNQIYIEEMISVPYGLRRDQADATAGAFNKLALSGPAATKVLAKGLWEIEDGKFKPD